ncbi:putative Phosphonate-transporting ATPase [Paraburkholderia ribeironis]|uniref:Putative Phosphonate-transporting ATPase n=1 Tax=Paraburkholderia ribeironis TaxID=1247936 RepID=A0A1N7RXG0_9BURK|nr:putative Phosphonate-transporting ATPase [Paraburkholderia ribeironis]
MYKLIVDDLHKKFGENEVLKGVSLRAKAGDVISLIGSSGSGKSSLLRCINFLESPCSGSITLDGEEIRTTTDRSGVLRASDPRQLQKMRTRLSMVFQHFNLWAHMTVLENVMEAPVSVLGLNRSEAEARAQILDKSGSFGRFRAQVSVAFVRRSAAAGSNCPSAGDGAGSDAFRRADLRSRPRACR